MHGSVSSKLVATLARIAGFTFSPERCQQLAPQLEWLLTEARRIEELLLAGQEPVGVFRPRETVANTPQEGEGDAYK